MPYANWCGSGFGFSLSLWCGSGVLFDADPDLIWSGSGFLFDADPGYQNYADTCESGSTTLVITITIDLITRWGTFERAWGGGGGVSLYVPDILYPLHGRQIASRFHYQAPDCTLQWKWDIKSLFFNSSYFKYGLDQGSWYTDVIAQNISNLLTTRVQCGHMYVVCNYKKLYQTVYTAKNDKKNTFL